MDQITSPDALTEEPATLIREHRGMYMIINAIAHRARQLQNGERMLAYPPDGSRDPVRVATQEFLEGKLDIIARDANVDEAKAEQSEGE